MRWTAVAALAGGGLALAPALASARVPDAAAAGAAMRVVFDNGILGRQVAAGPVLVGDGLAWAGWDHDATRFYTAAGGKPRRLQALATGVDQFAGDDYVSGTNVEHLTATASHVAYVRSGFDSLKGKLEGNARTDEAIWLGDLGGAQAQLLACPSDVATASVALDGTLLAQTGCSDRPAVAVRDLAVPGAAAQELAADGSDVRIADPYVAWRTADAIVVYDRVAGGEAYRVNLTHAQLPGPVVAYDLQRDGKIAIGMTDPQSAGVGYVAWAAPGAAAPRLLARLDGAPGPLRMAGDRIAVRTERFAQGRGADPLQLLDLAGAVRTVARIYPAGGGLDFDGSRVAWAGEVCATAVLHIADADAPAVVEDRTTHCAVEIDGGSVRLDKRGRGYVGLSCPAPRPARRRDACAGRVLVRTAAGRTLSRTRFRIPAGESDVGLIRLARHRPRRVRVVVRSRTRSHLSTSRAVLRVR